MQFIFKTIYRKAILLFLILIGLTSCSKDDDKEELCNNIIYDSCCIRGSDFAAPNEELNFVYTFKIINAEVEWEIINGDATVLNVENSNSGGETVSIATIKFNGDFSVARLKAKADTEIHNCAYYYNVSQE
tara:strand:+ start:1011 stop:1403 length:393 start_codon:yes stop_codon:yes gene_type:complete